MLICSRMPSNWVNNFSVVIPLRRAWVELSCMVGPSANGSEKGKPISTMSTPAASSFFRIGTVSSRLGKPAEKYMDNSFLSSLNF